jgi:nitroreductase
LCNSLKIFTIAAFQALFCFSKDHIMQRRNFIRLAGGGTVAAATVGLSGCLSSNFPAQAIEAWSGPAANETDPRRRALAYAITAPNPHNLQPWLVDLRQDNRITLYTDPSRILPETDPFGRQILVGHGCFLELLVMALAEQGMGAQVSLWPQGELPAQPKDWKEALSKPIASLALQPGASKDALFAQILKRHTVKVNFDTARSVSDASLQQLLTSAASAADASRMRVSGTVAPVRLEPLRKLCLDSAMVELNTPRTLMESIRLVRVGPSEISQHRDGISINSPFVRAISAVGMFDRSQPPAPGSAADKNAKERFAGHSNTAMGFVWIAGGNARSDQIQAGRAYVRLQLQATAMGLGMHPMSQALQEFPEMKPYYEQAHQLLLGHSAPRSASDPTVQMFCRIGYAATPAAATPRRALEQFVRTA